MVKHKTDVNGHAWMFKDQTIVNISSREVSPGGKTMSNVLQRWLNRRVYVAYKNHKG